MVQRSAIKAIFNEQDDSINKEINAVKIVLLADLGMYCILRSLVASQDISDCAIIERCALFKTGVD